MAKKFKGILVKRVEPNHEMSYAEAETVETLIKEGYIVLYDRRKERCP